MAVVTVDGDWYRQVADKALTASSDIHHAMVSLQNALAAGEGMGGNDRQAQEWARDYDPTAAKATKTAGLLSTALSCLAARANQAGHNHDVVEAAAARAHGGHALPVRGESGYYNATRAVKYQAPPPAAGAGNISPLQSPMEQLILERAAEKEPAPDFGRLERASDAWRTLATTVSESVGSLISAGNNPPDPDADDVAALRSELNNTFATAGDALEALAMTLASSVSDFASSMSSYMDGIRTEATTVNVKLNAIGVVVTGGVLIAKGAAAPVAARLVARGNEIINAGGRTVASLSSTVRAAIAATNIASTQPSLPSHDERLRRSIDHPAAGVEIDDQGRVKQTDKFPPMKEGAWQRYLERMGSEALPREEWSRLYDQLMENAANGSDFNVIARDVMGYTRDNGWLPEYEDATIPGRRWDFANPELQELVENKSGALDRNQLVIDEVALRRGWSVTYNLSKHVSAGDLALLENLEAKYPGKFRYQWIVP